MSELDQALCRCLPASTVQVWCDEDPLLAAAADITVRMTENHSEFPIGLDVDVLLDEGGNMQHWLLGLARSLSIELSCRTICDGTGFGDDESPCWSLVWERGVPYLADDLNSALADGEGGAVRIVRRVEDVNLKYPAMSSRAKKRAP